MSKLPGKQVDPKFEDGSFQLSNSNDPTKKANFDLSNLTTGAVRSFALPDQDGTLALNNPVAWGRFKLKNPGGYLASSGFTTYTATNVHENVIFVSDAPYTGSGSTPGFSSLVTINSDGVIIFTRPSSGFYDYEITYSMVVMSLSQHLFELHPKDNLTIFSKIGSNEGSDGFTSASTTDILSIDSAGSLPNEYEIWSTNLIGNKSTDQDIIKLNIRRINVR